MTPEPRTTPREDPLSEICPECSGVGEGKPDEFSPRQVCDVCGGAGVVYPRDDYDTEEEERGER